MSKNIVFEGWLTKSPPSKRIWRTKWRRRWFALRQSGELPGQYFLDYYADRNCRRHKGTINLDLCEQVDAGLHMERSANGALDPKLRGSVFTIQTQTRTYHLEADCEAEMEKWVDAICRVCGLRATDESSNVVGSYPQTMVDGNEYGERVTQSTGPYIPISECITGVRDQDTQTAFSFDPNHLVINTDQVTRANLYLSQPLIPITNSECSDNDSNEISDDDSKSFNTCIEVNPNKILENFSNLSMGRTEPEMYIVDDEDAEDEANMSPPTPPPRPPKSFTLACNDRPPHQGPMLHEPTNDRLARTRQLLMARCQAQGIPYVGYGDEEEDSRAHSLQYYNIPSLPPVVDRNLKPRYSGYGLIHSVAQRQAPRAQQKEIVLQYLDLDLHTSKPPPANDGVVAKPFIHGKVKASDECVYKTVDFLKTEAFNNISRQYADDSNSYQE